jgi:hypothetical protein
MRRSLQGKKNYQRTAKKAINKATKHEETSFIISLRAIDGISRNSLSFLDQSTNTGEA